LKAAVKGNKQFKKVANAAKKTKKLAYAADAVQ